MPDQDQTAAPEMSRAHSGDSSWATTQPIQVVPTSERLNAPSQRVTVRNTSPDQRHIVIDRFQVGHELQPGESTEVEMLVKELEYFQRQRSPNRRDAFGRSFPPHPLEFVGLKPIDPEPKRKATAAAGSGG